MTAYSPCDTVAIQRPIAPKDGLDVSSGLVLGHFDFSYGANARKFSIATGAVGSISVINSQLVAVAPSGNPSSSAHCVSLERFGTYQGDCILVDFGAAFTVGTGVPANSSQLVGWGDGSDGLFIGVVGTQFGVVHRKGGNSDFTPITNFNVDKLDLVGASEMILVPGAGNIYRISYQLDGFGQARFYVLNPATNKFVLMHQVSFGGAQSTPQVPVPCFPFRIELANPNGSSSISTSVASFTISFHQPRIPAFSLQGGYSNSSPVGAGEGFVPILSIRNELNYNGFANVLPILIEKFSGVVVPSASPNAVQYQLVVNPTLAGDNFSTPDVTSHTAVDIDASSYSGGIVIHDSISNELNLNDGGWMLAPGDILTLVASNVLSSNSLYAGVTWKEAV